MIAMPHSIDILIAHESSATSSTMAERLTSAGFRVALAHNLSQGFDALYGEKPQLAIISSRMRDRAALKLALASQARGAKVIVIDDQASPHETSASIRAFTNARFIQRRAALSRLLQDAQALLGEAPTAAAPVEASAAA
jgi:DNA-binding NtrC family response regulator